ncbi:unnamed protein product, partial [Schistosoma turkestanicum]
SRLVRFQLAQGGVGGDPLHNAPISSRNEYQTLTSFHRGDVVDNDNSNNDKQLNKTTTPILFSNWIKSDQHDQLNESLPNSYDQFNGKTSLNTSKLNSFNPSKQNHTLTTNNNHNSSISHNNNSNNNVMFPDFFQLQPLMTNSQLSNSHHKHELPSRENSCQSDEFYMSTFNSNKKFTKPDGNLIFTNNNNHVKTPECMHHLPNCNRTPNDMNKSPEKSIIEEKKIKSTRPPKMVTLISPKKESPTAKENINDIIHEFYTTDKITTPNTTTTNTPTTSSSSIINKPLNAEVQF